MSWYEFDDFSFEIEARSLKRDGKAVPLTPKAGDLLLLFLENCGKLITKEEIKRRVWPDSAYVEDNSLLFQVSAVRGALGRRANGEAYIETLAKRGYKFVAPAVKRGESEQGIVALLIREQVSDSSELQPATRDILAAGRAKPRLWPVRRFWRIVLPGVLLVIALRMSLAFLLPPSRHLRVARYDALTRDTRENVGGPLFTDGMRVYFREESPQGGVLSYVAVAGGETGIAFPIADKWIQDLSPLRSEFLATQTAWHFDGGQLWVIPLAGGPRRLIGDLRASSAYWSPDKEQIAFTVKSELYVAKANGTGQRRVATVPGNAVQPRWSPDGKMLCFTEDDSAQSETWNSMWEVGVDGSNPHRLLQGWNSPPNETCAGWTPDGNFLVFQSLRGGRSDVWEIPKRSKLFGKEYGAPVPLSSGLEGFGSPVISPDGKQIFAIAVAPRGKLERYDFDLHDFVPFMNGISALWVAFSPSGRSVAYVDYSDRTIWRQNLDGSDKTQITFSPLESEGLSWSPDGKWFAMRARLPGKPWRIELVSSDGGVPRPIVPGDGEQAIPTWSADSKHIALGDVPRINGKASGYEVIHILDLTTHVLTEMPGSKGLWTARYSPDGRYLSALTVEGERLKLFDLRTKKWRATQADHVKNPAWSMNGKYIYYDSEALDRALRRVRVADGHVEQLVNLKGHPILDATWIGVTPDNSPLILSDVGSAEIYSLVLESR